MAQDKKLKDAIHNKLVETGEYDRCGRVLGAATWRPAPH